MTTRTLLIGSILIASLSAGIATAKNPPKLPRPAASWHQTGPSEEGPTPAPAAVGPAQSFPASPVASSGYYPPSFLRVAGRFSAATTAQMETGSRPPASPLNVPATPSVLYSANASQNDNAQFPVTESALYTINKVVNNVTTPYTVAAFMRWDGAHYVAKTSYTTNLTWNGTLFTPVTVTLSPGYTDLVDPTLAANPYAAGVRPGALYLGALCGNRNVNLTNPTAIHIWASDDGGVNWGNGVDAAVAPEGTAFQLDKPVLDVSWYPDTLGYIHMAWVELYAQGANRIIYRRNTGGLSQRCRPATGGCITSWDSPIAMTPGTVNEYDYAPQVVANPERNEVYVFWLTAPGSLNPGELRMRRSTDGGATFGDAITLVQNIKPTTRNGFLLNGFHAVVTPNIRFNTGTHRAVAVWHQQLIADSNDLALYYLSFDPATVSGPLITNPQWVINGPGTQMQPTFDNDDAGNGFVSYYTNDEIDPHLYRLAGFPVWPSGTIGTPALLSSDPSPAEDVGDYHDNFFFTYTDFLGGRWNSTWANRSGNADVWATGVK